MFYVYRELLHITKQNEKPKFTSNTVVSLWNRTLVAFVDKLSSTTVNFIRSEGELKNCALYGF